MKWLESLKYMLIAGVVLVLLPVDVDAQCAMCKAVAKSDLETGGDIGNGINTGILYLMAIPYVILTIGGYFFFKKSIDEKLKELRNKYFGSKKTVV
jgi:high-affinity nickel permease